MLRTTQLIKIQFSKLIQRYKSAKDGVAAIEFVFVAPIMIAMYFGLAEMSTAISADRKISHGTNIAGDLATQVAEISADQMSEIMTAATLVMGVPTDRLNSVQMQIASFSKDATGAVVPLGKAEINGPYPTRFNADDLDDLILSEASGVVVARVAYDYEPLKLRFFDANFTLTETFLLKPRKSATIDLQDGAGAITDFTCSFSGRVVNCS